MRFVSFARGLMLLLLASVLATGCATATTSSTEGGSADAMTLFEVHKDGRIYIFYDKALYEDFLAHGEVPYRLTRIGAGPHGETIVIGLTKKDKKLHRPVPAVEMLDGKIKPPRDFYGEMDLEGRIYVFDDYEEMKKVREIGEPIYRYTMIGAGPNGETVVIALTKANKKKRPDALIQRFKAMHNLKQGLWQ